MGNSKRDGSGKFARSKTLLGKVDALSESFANHKGFTLSGGHVATAHKHVVLYGLKGIYLGCDKRGSAMRSHVVWWLNTGEAAIGWNFKWVIHHKDHDKLNDSFDNLEKLAHGEHSSLHHPISLTTRECRNCGNNFSIRTVRLREPSRGSFCGQPCYQAYKARPEMRAAHSAKLRRRNQEEKRYDV